MGSENSEKYFNTRLTYDKKREILWKVLAKEFSKDLIKVTDTVVELGAGWCDFINALDAHLKYAVDVWPEVAEMSNGSVIPVISSVETMHFLGDHTVDVFFASNLFEHLSQDQLASTLFEIKRALKHKGKLIVIQPNYSLAYKKYFDDYTHISIWSDKSLCDFLQVNGFEVSQVRKRFLPLSLKSRFPVSSFLIQLYLKLPFKLFAGQMLVVAHPSKPK